MDKSLASTGFPTIPKIILSSRRKMPVMAMGTCTYPPVEPEITKLAVLQAIKTGYRHFDTSPMYQTEEPLGEAIEEAFSLGLVKSRDDLFIASKLWCADAHPGLVLPALKKTLSNLKLEYLDLYIIHWPVSCKAGIYEFPIKEENLMPMDFKSVWEEMEQCHRLGLAKSIGVSNFSCKKLASILETATIPPSVNEVEMSPLWQQKSLVKFCKDNGVAVIAYSRLGTKKGTIRGTCSIMDCEELHEIAEAKGKTVAQICLRWLYEQGVSFLAKSFNKERMTQNMEIFDWELGPEESKKIEEIPQFRSNAAQMFVSANGPFKTLDELWDGEI